MNFQEFKDTFREAWVGKYFDDSKQDILEEYGYSILASRYETEFYDYNYTEYINKEVEALWLQRNSKLAKALK